jgi:short-subunit dehydrogenase
VSSLLRMLRRRARRPMATVARLANHPIGRVAPPLDPRRMVERLRGQPTLADAAAGRVVMVTGASSGIGEAVAREVGGAGARVVLVARGEDRLEEVAAEIEAAAGEASVHPCDLTDLDAIDSLVADVLEAEGGVDVLVNSAGRSIRRSVELSAERFDRDFERTMQLNYFGAVRLIVGLLPTMRERPSPQVINISSAGVQTRTPRFSAYIASKAALDAFSDAVQAETLADGMRFTTISMPLVRTPMIAPSEHYRGFPALTPEQAADLVAEAIVRRPRRISPSWAHLVSLTDAVSPELMDAVRNRGYRMFPESAPESAAPAEPGGDGERPAGSGDDGETPAEPGGTGPEPARRTGGEPG